MRISDWSSDVCSSDLVHEAIYCLLMLRDGFIAGSANIERLDPRAEGYPIVRESRQAQLRTVMSNSFGFGGTNARLVFAKDRKGVVEGKSVSVRVDLGGRRLLKKQNTTTQHTNA